MTRSGDHSHLFWVTPTAAQRRWTTFLRVTGLREVLSFLECSVPLTGGRLHRLHSAGTPGS